MTRRYDRTKEAWWRHHLARWQASDQSVRVYCEQHGLAEANFYRWRRVLAERPSPPDPAVAAPPRFVAVALEAAHHDQRIEVLLAGGQRLRVAPGFDPATLARLVAVLEGRPC